MLSVVRTIEQQKESIIEHIDEEEYNNTCWGKNEYCHICMDGFEDDKYITYNSMVDTYTKIDNSLYGDFGEELIIKVNPIIKLCKQCDEYKFFNVDDIMENETEYTEWNYTGEFEKLELVHWIIRMDKEYKQKCYKGIDKYLYPVLNKLIISFI